MVLLYFTPCPVLGCARHHAQTMLGGGHCPNISLCAPKRCAPFWAIIAAAATYSHASAHIFENLPNMKHAIHSRAFNNVVPGHPHCYNSHQTIRHATQTTHAVVPPGQCCARKLFNLSTELQRAKLNSNLVAHCCSVPSQHEMTW